MNVQLNDVIELARGAGQILRDGFGQRHQVSYKGEIDLVTEVDKNAEDYLLNQIAQRYPGTSAVAEEGGSLSGEGGGKWYLDPIDGTLNYTHGLPIFCVSIGYEFEGQMRLGVVYNPIYEEMYTAELGEGAHLNGEAIHVTDVDELKRSLLVTGFPYDAWTNPDSNFPEYEHFSRHSRGVRRLGSAALDLCFVAAGRLDGFWELRLNAWDVAAGALIAQEAGALVTNIDGEEDFISPPQSIMTANPRLHAKMLKEMKKVRSRLKD